MYSVGDKIFIPMCGAGIIDEIREISILDQTNYYYVVNLKHENMTVMIPMSEDDKCKLRPISSKEDIDKALDMLSQEATTMDKNWSKRIRKNNLRLESGNIFEMADIIRNLYIADEKSPLASGERKMLSKTINTFSSEISLCLNMDFDKAKTLVSLKVSTH